jgi:cell division septation protein DedD
LPLQCWKIWKRTSYYVQLGAYADTSTVNEIVANIGKQFPAAVETGKMAEKPVYRVYIGPVNQGESGALLLRFKRGGYPDAFVKKGK